MEFPYHEQKGSRLIIRLLRLLRLHLLAGSLMVLGQLGKSGSKDQIILVPVSNIAEWRYILPKQPFDLSTSFER